MALATVPVAATFGVIAGPEIGAVPAIVMSILVWGSGAQFAALSVIGSGGTTAVAAAAGAATNARYLPMGFAIAPSLSFGIRSRAAAGLLLTDASFIIARRGVKAEFDPATLMWGAPLQYLAWVGGTIVGVCNASVLGDPRTYGLDVLFPVFFLGILLPEIRTEATRRLRVKLRRWPTVAALGSAAVTLILTPFTPVGIPVLAGAFVALLGLRTPDSEHVADEQQ